MRSLFRRPGNIWQSIPSTHRALLASATKLDKYKEILVETLLVACYITASDSMKDNLSPHSITAPCESFAPNDENWQCNQRRNPAQHGNDSQLPPTCENTSLQVKLLAEAVKCHCWGHKIMSFYQFFRYCHKNDIVVFSVQSSIKWALFHLLNSNFNEITVDDLSILFILKLTTTASNADSLKNKWHAHVGQWGRKLC